VSLPLTFSHPASLPHPTPPLATPPPNSPKDITWHENDWNNPDSRFLAWTLHDTAGRGCGDLYFAFNTHHHEVPAHLPAPPAGQKWCRVVDTNLPSPKDFTVGGNSGVDPQYGVAPFAAIMLVSKEE
jgi:isoamylase